MSDTDNKTTEAPKGSSAVAAAAEPEKRPSARERAEASLEARREELAESLEPADISAATATKLEASGAFIEDGAKKEVEVSHPAVDNNPRAGTTVNMNRIDFNDPDLREEEAVRQNLGS